MANKYYTVELTEKQYNHIHNALNCYEHDVHIEKLSGQIQLHNATVKALENYGVSSCREKKRIDTFFLKIKKENQNNKFRSFNDIFTSNGFALRNTSGGRGE